MTPSSNVSFHRPPVASRPCAHKGITRLPSHELPDAVRHLLLETMARAQTSKGKTDMIASFLNPFHLNLDKHAKTSELIQHAWLNGRRGRNDRRWRYRPLSRDRRMPKMGRRTCEANSGLRSRAQMSMSPSGSRVVLIRVQIGGVLKIAICCLEAV